MAKSTIATGKFITLDDDVFQHKIRKLAKKFGVEEKQFVKEQGAAFVNDIGRFVPPYKTFPVGKSRTMGGAKDNKAGQLAVMYDLKKLFFVPNAAVYTWAENKFKRGEIFKGRKVIGAGVAKSIDEMKNFHNKHRNIRTGRPRSLKGFQQMWVSEKLFKKYYALEKADVGTAKGALATAVKMLNPKYAIPAWIAKQMGKAHGSGRCVKIADSWTAVFKCRAFGLQHVRPSMVAIVQKGRLKAMENRLKFIFKDAAKKSGWKVR
tara:strand:- start:4101 stop:4889 length:789 start_codon:yes stop_codon:yes gene_type:complete